MKTDTQLQADVLEEIRADPQTPATEIGVAVSDGVVTLSGEVDSLAKRLSIGRAAARVRGVRAVADKLLVHLPLDHRQTDEDLAHAVVNALIWDTEVPDKTIKARVQDRWVWLVGEAEWQYQRVAAQCAIENLRGIKGVTNLVRIKRRVPATELQAQIEAALARNAKLQDRTIGVAVDGTAVVLTGTVQSWGERMAAEHAAWSAPATDVDNRLAVSA
jgi:osmotically-inducible protein OsmY